MATTKKSRMPLGGLAPWYGSKRWNAPVIVSELVNPAETPPRSYFELFAGSAAVFFEMPETKYETISDLHGGMICLARVVADEVKAPQLMRRLDQTPFCEALYNEGRAFLAACEERPAWRFQRPDVGEKPVLLDSGGERLYFGRADENMTEYAFWFLVVSWMGRNGTAGQSRSDSSNFCVRYTPTGGSSSVRWRAVAQSVPAWHDRLKNATILLRDAFEIIPKIPDRADICIYADPPYLLKTKSYQHDFAATPDEEADQHDRLAELLWRFKHARVVVSYYDHERVKQLYPGWTIRETPAPKFLAQSAKGRGITGRTDAAELLIINGPSYAGGACAGSLF